MGRTSRPRFATLVRVRQEVSKRLDSALGTPSSVDARELRELLAPEAVGHLDRLSAWFASRAGQRFPRRHLLSRDARTLPDRDRLEALAEEAARGDWNLFGTPVPGDIPNRWTTHPLSGAATPASHWRRIAYLSGGAGGDVKFIWELNRHHALLRIAQGYFVTRRPELAERVVALVDAWVQSNPPARGINWTSSLEVAFRSIAWCWIWSLTADSPAWTDERLARFLVSLWHHGRHIDRYDSTHHSPNTHLTGELLGLYYIGLTFPELKRAKRWARRGRSGLISELERQVFPDGMHFERSVGYHRYTAEFYLHFMLLARAADEPVPSSVGDRVRALVAASWLTRRPDGTWPVIGDEDSGSTLLVGTGDAQSHSTILAVGAALFGEPAWVAGADTSGRSGAWWLLDDALWSSLGTLAPASGPVSGTLRDAGYFVGRDGPGPDTWYCLVDAGPHGGDSTGHAHTDLGHIEIARGATHIVVDPGCASYTREDGRRDWYRSEAAHASLVIAGVPLAVPRGPFAWEQIHTPPTATGGDDGMVWWCELVYQRAGTAGEVSHRRQVSLLRGVGVIVADWVEAAAAVDFALHWPLGVDVTLEKSTVRGPGFAAHVSIGRGESQGVTLDPIRVSPGYGRERDATLLRVPVRCNGRASIVTAFVSDHTAMKADEGKDGTLTCRLTAPRDMTVVMQPGRAPTVSATVHHRG